MIQFSLLNTSHLPHICKLQQEVANTADSSSYIPHTEQELLDILGERGKAVGAWSAGELCGFHTALFPGLDEENLGIDVGLAEEELEHAFHLEFACVHKDYRGQRLQRRMAHVLIDHILDLGYKHMMETVSPLNVPSLRNTLALGMNIVALKEKYGFEWRYIFYKNLQVESNIDHSMTKACLLEDRELQISLLKKGYVGTNINCTEEKVEIIFAHHKSAY